MPILTKSEKLGNRARRISSLGRDELCLRLSQPQDKQMLRKWVADSQYIVIVCSIFHSFQKWHIFLHMGMGMGSSWCLYTLRAKVTNFHKCKGDFARDGGGVGNGGHQTKSPETLFQPHFTLIYPRRWIIQNKVVLLPTSVQDITHDTVLSPTNYSHWNSHSFLQLKCEIFLPLHIWTENKCKNSFSWH